MLVYVTIRHSGLLSVVVLAANHICACLVLFAMISIQHYVG